MNALRETLLMWIAIKEGCADDSWDHLVDAQIAARSAVRAHPTGEQYLTFGEWLHDIEHTIFPSMTFVSSGHTCNKSKCSICNDDYGKCDHLAGRPYGGVFCSQILTEISHVDHVAIVSEPADKHCRFTEVGDYNGAKRNILSWHPSPSEYSDNNSQDDQLTFKTIAARGI
jgi:hypothetical protein